MKLFIFYGVFVVSIKGIFLEETENNVCTKIIIPKSELQEFKKLSKQMEGFFKDQKPIITCQYPWVAVGGACTFADISANARSFNEARTYCRQKHPSADLAIFKDANEFAEVLDYIRNINNSKKVVHFWIGGTVENKNRWEWINGAAMPTESPFWGVWDSRNEGTIPHHEQCAGLFSHNRYFIHDFACQEIDLSPLCQHRAL